MNKKSVLTFLEARKLVEQYGSPLMVISKDLLNEKIELFHRYLPQVKIHYAMKSNPAECIVRHLASQNLSFDVASAGEIKQLAGYGISGSRMIYANPTKNWAGLASAK